MAIFLSGGGSGEKSRKVDAKFIGSIPNGKPILYVPLARNPPYESCMDWIKSNFKPLDLSNFYMVDNIEKLEDIDMSAYSGVYIGGGNTYKLLGDLKSTGFLKVLKDHITKGGLAYGGSAGAIIMGEDIGTADSENMHGMNDTQGLGLANGFSVYCHYTEEDNKRIQEYRNSNNHDVLAITEDAGIHIDGSKMEAIGPGSITVFSSTGRHLFSDGSVIN